MTALDRDPSSHIERLLEEGLDLFHSGLVDHAVAVWTEVLHIEPNERRAVEYLRQAGANAEESVPPAELAGTRQELEQLLVERRYEEALDLLFSARRLNPDAIEISRGIQLLKQRLVRRYLHQIGNLDHVPNLAISSEAVEARKLSEEQTEVLRLIDGVSSYGDIAHESRLGRFETFRTLSTLVSDGVLTASPDMSPADSGDHPAVPAPTPTPMAPSPEPATPDVLPGDTPITSKRSRAPSRIGWVLLTVIAVLGVAGAVLYVTAPSSPTTGAPEEVVGQAAAVTPAAPAVALPAAAADGAPEAAVPTAAPVEPVEIVVPPTPEPIAAPLPSVPPPRSAVKAGRTRVVRAVPVSPRPAITPPAPPATAPAPSEDRSASPAPMPDAAKTEAAAEPAGASKDRDAPAATPAPTQPARLDAITTVATVTVQGALTRSEVDRALRRVVPSLRACYVAAATRAGHDAASAIKLSFTLDETGLAQSAEAAAAALPGLSDCLREAAHQVRTQVRPDVGVVYVTATVTFAPLGP